MDLHFDLTATPEALAALAGLITAVVPLLLRLLKRPKA
jgi:hypothetical protein